MFFPALPRRRRPRDPLDLFLAAGFGALATVLVNAMSEHSRRVRMRDGLEHGVNGTVDLLGKALRDGRNRINGAIKSARAAISRGYEPQVSDVKLVARVRSRLGRLVLHPHAVGVGASDGCVVLTGQVSHREVARLVRSVRRVPGVRGVEAYLDVRDDDVLSLNGRRRAHVPEVLHEHWTPSLRVGAAIVGMGALAGGLARLSTPLGIGLAGGGALLFVRTVFDAPLGQVLGIGGKRRSVDIQKTITIHAPVEQVFAYWADFETFPQIMDHVESVRMTSNRRSHWRVRGPLGSNVEWDAETTRFIKDKLIAWKSVDGSLVKHAGIVRFEAADGAGGATRIDIRLTYNPVVGHIGHGFATLFGVDPKTSLDDDLLRLKSLIEDGKATAHGREITRDEVRVVPFEGDDDAVASTH